MLMMMMINSAGVVQSFLPASGFECLLMQYVFHSPNHPFPVKAGDISADGDGIGINATPMLPTQISKLQIRKKEVIFLV